MTALWKTAAVLCFCTAAAHSQAVLYDRGDGLIYDSALNITWLRDADYAGSQYEQSGGSKGLQDGLGTWAMANAWVNSLTYAGYTDWRLPGIKPANGSAFTYGFSNNGSTDRGYGMSNIQSELAHLWYVDLGNKGYCAPSALNPGGCQEQKSPDETDVFGNMTPGVPIWGASNLGVFAHVDTSVFGLYWIGTPYEPSPDFGAWFFDFTRGLQDAFFQDSYLHAWAVRDGDVAAIGSIPEPASAALFGLAICGLLACCRPRGKQGKHPRDAIRCPL